MKTSDGHMLILGETYLLANGQAATLTRCAVTPGGQDIFIACPIYQFEVVEAGDKEEDLTVHEHLGPEICVTSIFRNAPSPKIDARHKNRLAELENISITIGVLTNTAQTLKLTESRLKEKIEVLQIAHVANLHSLQNHDKKLETLKNLIEEKEHALKKLESALEKFETDNFTGLITKRELERLNKSDFKLRCLENGGVTEWLWYPESMEAYDERYPNDEVRTAEKEQRRKNFPVVERKETLTHEES